MKVLGLYLMYFCGTLLFFGCDSANNDTKLSKQLAEGEKRLGDQIRAILKHYQQDDPIGLPGVPIPDPIPVPKMEHSFAMSATMYFKDIQVYGLSKFRIRHIESELAKMQVAVQLDVDTLNIRGIYTLKSFWYGQSTGNFTVKLTGVVVQGIARLQVATDGKLQAEDIDMDLTFDSIDIDFKNLGVVVSFLQGILNGAGTIVFDSVKPFILKEVNANIKGEVNKRISQLPQYFPNSISPFDMAVAQFRKQISEQGYDPYKVKDYTQSVGIFTVTSSNTWISGVASFYRMGNITLTMENGTVYAVMDVGTQEIEGKTHWEVSVIGGVLSRAGTVTFTIQYFRAQVNLSQSLDTRKRAILEDVNLELGNIQARIHGAGTLDYALEASINILPNVLRYQIMDAIEGPLKRRLQDELNKVDVEKLIEEKIPDIEEQARLLQEHPPEDEDTNPEEPLTNMEDFDSRVPFRESEEDRGPS